MGQRKGKFIFLKLMRNEMSSRYFHKGYDTKIKAGVYKKITSQIALANPKAAFIW